MSFLAGKSILSMPIASPNAKWEVDFYKDPRGFERQVWVRANAANAMPRNLYEHTCHRVRDALEFLLQAVTS